MNRTENNAPDSLPNGFRYAGVACGIKVSGKPDLSLITSDWPIVAAGVYTRNQVVAAPVVLCRLRTPSTSIRAVVTNSGNANACTGEQGEHDATEMCARVADHLGCEPTDVLVMSTGVIGMQLPMDCIRVGIDDAFSCQSTGRPGFDAASQAILTTDQGRKIAFRTLECDREIHIAAMAKGAGMIAPNMATMLAVVCTDACLTAKDAQRIIEHAASVSFNRASVDGHTSTNDTLLLLASGQGDPLAGDDLARVGEAIDEVSIQLAKELVADGEGATHVMTIHVSGAGDDAAADTIARTVAASPLVKTAITGGDPNWGRIVSAAGYAAARIDPGKTSLEICGTRIYENGTPLPFDAAALSAIMKSDKNVEIHLCVGDGSGKTTFWSSDLTPEYVRFNSEYTT
jgi:glutamate N-acetyltransferase/amino-acid N-acetyltransferase